jgi:hypothetical protein
LDAEVEADSACHRVCGLEAPELQLFHVLVEDVVAGQGRPALQQPQLDQRLSVAQLLVFR